HPRGLPFMKTALPAIASCALLSACIGPVPADHNAIDETEQALVASPKKVAYYPLWTSSGDDLVASFPQAPASLPWTKVTHINAAFVGIDANWGCAFVDASGAADPASQSAAQALINYRNANHQGVTIMIAVGGWSMSYRFSEAFMNATNRTAFVNSCVSLVNSMGADGLDIDWEFPTSLGAGNCASGHTCQ